MKQTLTITRPDDWHIHLRDDAFLARTVNDAARQFHRAIVMPNLKPPVTNAERAEVYRSRIVAALEPGLTFEPLMVLYLTDNTSTTDIVAAKAAGVVACKLYPAGATTHSDSGVTDISKLSDVFAVMAECGMLLLIHGEVTHDHVDIFEREARFIDETLSALVDQYPQLKIVFEHISTARAVAFVTAAPSNVAATITAHHLLFNRNQLLAGGIKPHYYCLPILKTLDDQQALIDAATSGNPKFFLGTDSAPHPQSEKESACGCAGCYTAYAAMELYAEAFERADALDKLEAFASHYGPDFYGLPRNTDTITLEQVNSPVPTAFSFGEAQVIPLKAGETLRWRLQELAR